MGGELAALTEHPLRRQLDAEFHARPPLPLSGAMHIAHLAFVHETSDAAREREHVLQLNADNSWQVTASSDTYVMLERDGVRVRWEQHTEFSSYTLFKPIGADDPVAASALHAVPQEWLNSVAGQLVVATQIELRTAAECPPQQVIAEYARSGRQLVLSNAVDGLAWVFTDFRIEDGSSHFLLIDGGMSLRQVGRTVQRLWEIETYRTLALLGLPVARKVGRWLRGAEDQLAALMDRIDGARSAADEHAVLTTLSALAAEVEHSVAATAFRFGASRAYFDIVLQRVEELREQRVQGFPTLREFMERRLRPPMNTCLAMAQRQEDLSGRVARNSQLLRTRVDIELEQQTQQLLAEMNRRSSLQLRLQETVEGLSVVAITYYGSQLMHYLAKGASKFWTGLSPELVTALSIPPIAVVVALGLRRMRRKLADQMD